MSPHTESKFLITWSNHLQCNPDENPILWFWFTLGFSLALLLIVLTSLFELFLFKCRLFQENHLISRFVLFEVLRECELSKLLKIFGDSSDSMFNILSSCFMRVSFIYKWEFRNVYLPLHSFVHSAVVNLSSCLINERLYRPIGYKEIWSSWLEKPF